MPLCAFAFALAPACAPVISPADAARDSSRDSAIDGARADVMDAAFDRTESSLDARADAPVDVAPDAPPDVARDVPPTEPAFDALPWTVVGLGVSYKDSHNPRGENVFIGYAGYGVNADQSRAWATQLFHATLHDRGVRYVYSVQGPASVGYNEREIQNTRLIANLLPSLSPATHFIAIAGHSSGGWVACELLQQLYEGGLDPGGLTRGRTVYYDMDGVQSCVDATMVGAMRRVYFMSAHTNAGGGGSAINAAFMMQGATRLGSGGYREYDATGSGCQPSAGLCLHIALINTHPNDSSTGVPQDYADYSRGAVNTWFLDTTAADLPL